MKRTLIIFVSHVYLISFLIAGEYVAVSDTMCINSEGIPPVGDQVVSGSCFAWAAAYYYLTHLQWQEYGWDVTDPAHQCSPAFVYNLTNGGVDDGAWKGDDARSDAFKVFKTLGCATMADMPYHYTTYLNFPSEDAFRNGMSFRTLETHKINTTTPEGIKELKNHLLGGNLAVLGILGYVNLDDIRFFDNTYCLSEISGSRLYWHEVTVIGFDDTRVTTDGVGAFRLVNSWSDRWGDRGFFWMSYEAVMSSKTASGYAMYATDRINYEPTLVARVEVEHLDRYNLTYTAGLGAVESPEYILRFFDFNPMSLQVGVPYPSSALMIDLSDIGDLFNREGSNRVFLIAKDEGTNNGIEGSIKSLIIEDLLQQLSSSSLNTPVFINDSGENAVATVELDYSFSPVENLTAILDSTTGQVLLSWEIPDDLGSFSHFCIYRDGELIDSTTSNTYTDQLYYHGNHQYGLSVFYGGGESLQKATTLFWQFPFGIPFSDDFESGLSNWEPSGSSGILPTIREEPVYDGLFSLGLQTNEADNNLIWRGFEPLDGINVEVWFNMESFPNPGLGFGSCIALGNPQDSYIGTFINNNGLFACIDFSNPQQLPIVILDSTVVIDKNEWYKQRIQYNDGKLHAMLIDNEFNVLVNEVENMPDNRINELVLVAWGLSSGWNYFDKFSMREWDNSIFYFFSPVEPTDIPYALIIDGALIDGDSLSEGDEIAVFDRKKCVGAAIVDGDWPLELDAWGAIGNNPGFTDGKPMTFRIWRRDNNTEYIAEVSFEVGNGTFGDGIFSSLNLLGGIAVNVKGDQRSLPVSFSLSQPHPNPFNSTTVIEFSIPKGSFVSLNVYDILGREIEQLLNNKYLDAGYYKLQWNANLFPSGIYFVEMTGGKNFIFTRKMLLTR